MAGSQVEFSGLLKFYATILLRWVPLGLAESNGQTSGNGWLGTSWSRDVVWTPNEPNWIIWLELFGHIRAQLDSPTPFATRQLPL